MSRRDEYIRADRYDDRDRDYRPRPRRGGDYEELDVDIRRTHSRGPERRADTAVIDRREERRERVPDFLREDYGRPTETQQLVIREDRRESDGYSRVSGRRRSNESLARSRGPERVREEEIIIRERERERDRPSRLPYPSSDIDRGDREVERERIIYQEAPRSRAPSRGPPSSVRGGTKEEIDISIRRREDDEARHMDIRGPRRDDRPPPSIAIDREEIDIRERRRVSPARSVLRGREGTREELDIQIRETDRREQVSRPRSRSRGNIVARKEEEWIVRRPRREPSPPPRDYEKEEIIIRRKERSISPEPPPREPTPEPPAPVLEPIIRPPIVQEVITHYRNIDHGFERAREPTPPPPPPSPPREREEDLEIAIRRTGTRNGKSYDEELIIEQDRKEREDDNRIARRQPSVAPPSRRRSPSRSRYERDEVTREAEYYNRQATSRGYPGEAWNGATKRWELVDIPPGTERVRMDGVGGGAQEITWQRYNGERTSKFYAGDRVYEHDYGREAPISAPPVSRNEGKVEETRIDLRRTTIEDPPRSEARHKTNDKMWTEVTKDLVIKEAIIESGYDFEETDQFYYVMEYLRYEDVVRLVELTEDIRRQRRERIREIQWEREELDRAPKMIAAPPPPPTMPGAFDERIYEREYVYDREGRRHR